MAPDSNDAIAAVGIPTGRPRFGSTKLRGLWGGLLQSEDRGDRMSERALFKLKPHVESSETTIAQYLRTASIIRCSRLPRANSAARDPGNFRLRMPSFVGHEPHGVRNCARRAQRGRFGAVRAEEAQPMVRGFTCTACSTCLRFRNSFSRQQSLRTCLIDHVTPRRPGFCRTSTWRVWLGRTHDDAQTLSA